MGLKYEVFELKSYICRNPNLEWGVVKYKLFMNTLMLD